MRRFASLTLLTLIAVHGVAQSKPDYVVTMVNDRRSNGSFSNLGITLELPSVKRSEVSALRISVLSAKCDAGTDLLPTDAQAAGFQSVQSTYGGDQPLTMEVPLKNPPRGAVRVAEVRGQIELAMPARDPNSVASVAKFLSLEGKPVSHRALKANGVDVTMMSRAQLSKERERLVAKIRAEAKAEGYEGEVLESIVSSHESMMFTPEEGDVVLRIKDPKKAIREISYVNGAGERQMVSTSDREEYVVVSTWGEKPKKDWSLRFDLNTAKSLRKIPFTLTNVPLP